MRESHLIVLGERGAGKRSLIQSLNKHCVRGTNKLIEVDKMGSQFSALDFEFLYVKDMSEKDAIHGIVTAEDNLPRLNIWMLQEPEKRDLLKATLKPEQLDMTAALIVIDMDQPWDLKDSLFKWMRLLEEVIKEVLNKHSLEKKTSLQKRIEKYIKSYKKVDDAQAAEEDAKISPNKQSAVGNGGKSKGNDSGSDSEGDTDMFDLMEENLQDQTPLGEGVL